MLEQTSHRGPDGCGVCVNGILKKAGALGGLEAADLPGDSGLGHSRLRITGTSGIQPLQSCDGRLVLGFNGEIWNYRGLREGLALAGHAFDTDSDGEAIVHLVEENHRRTGDLSASVLEACRVLDGEYAFAVYDTVARKAVLARDPVGIKQLYYGQNGRYLAFCSEKKPLWEIGIEPERVLPGRAVLMDFEPGRQCPVPVAGQNLLARNQAALADEEEALETYARALFSAVRKRVLGRDRVGIIFSGGVDSVVVAQIAKLLSCRITCYTSGFKGSPDIAAAVESSRELGLDLRVHELDEDEIGSELASIVSAIESSNHLQVDVAIPVYFAAKEARKDGTRVLLTGQGADEIFAGYEWYPEIFRRGGDRALSESLWNDIGNLYRDTLEREDKIAMYHSMELRVPYLDPEVISVAMSIPGNMKIRSNHVKYLHRRLAGRIGIPDGLAWRRKEAAQHGSLVHENLIRIIEKMAGRNRAGQVAGGCTEELGSAYRYGGGAYRDNGTVQTVLDSLGRKLGLYPRPEPGRK